MSARHSSFDIDGIPLSVLQSLRTVCEKYCTLCREIELLYEDTTSRVWDYNGNTGTTTVVPHRERLDRFRFLHRRNQLFDNTIAQIDESFLERTERPFWGPEQAAGVVRQNIETFYDGLKASEFVPFTTASPSDISLQNSRPLRNIRDYVVELIEQMAQLDYLVAVVNDTHGAIYDLMEAIEEQLDSDNSDYIDLGSPIDDLHYDRLSAEIDPKDVAALPKLPVDASMMRGQGDAECTICKDNVHRGDEVVVLPCKHWFHGGCIGPWLGISNTCPCYRCKAITTNS